MAKKSDVVVFGSCMIDLICYTARLPKPGETIHGTEFKMGHGGKGANQCVAAAKLGASTALIARLGNDCFGEIYKKELTSFGVNTEHVHLTQNMSSGMAQITVSETGENVITIVAGANNELSFEDAKKAENVLMSSKVVAFQYETPLAVTLETLQLIKVQGGPFTIVNGAPAMRKVAHQIYCLCDIFCVNESEAGVITDSQVKSICDAKLAVEVLQTYGCGIVIITLGPLGAVFAERGKQPQHIPTTSVHPVDTTGAGDAFIGALAFFTAHCPNTDLKTRIKRSCEIASISVKTKGTQSSFPMRQELDPRLFNDCNDT